MSEEVNDPQALLTAYNNLKEDVRKLSAERDELAKANEALQAASKDDVWRTRALEAEVRSALAGQGVKDVEKVLKHVKIEGLDFDENNKVTGLDEKLKELRQDLPSVFDPKARAGGKADIHEKDTSVTSGDPMRDLIRNAMAH